MNEETPFSHANLSPKEGREITNACNEYVEFHRLTINRRIQDKDTGSILYRPSFFTDSSPANIRRLLTHCHPQYKLIPKTK